MIAGVLVTLLTSLKEFEPDLLRARCSEWNSVPKPLHVSCEANPSPTCKVVRGDAGKIVYVSVSRFTRVATLQKIGVTQEERNGGVDSLAPIGRPNEPFV